MYIPYIVCIISPWAIFLTSALNMGGGLIIHTELIYKYHVYTHLYLAEEWVGL